MKKIAIVAAGVALSLAVAVPAFAHHRSSGTSVENDARVRNVIDTTVNSGYNEVESRGHGHHSGVSDSSITTGNVEAVVTVDNVVNSTDLGCGCSSRRGLRLENDAHVTNRVTTNVNSGYNEIEGGRVRGSDISTGAGLADVLVTNDVNSTVAGE